MPKPKDPDRGRLPMVVLHVLACGDLPVERVPGTGQVAALELKHCSGRPGVAAEMRRRWRDHHDAIVAAIAGRDALGPARARGARLPPRPREAVPRARASASRRASTSPP